MPVTAVRATRGKWLRAEPVATLYEQGRVKHAGVFPALEDEMCDFGLDGLSSGRSPDRLDALVWAVTALTLRRAAAAAGAGAVAPHLRRERAMREPVAPRRRDSGFRLLLHPGYELSRTRQCSIA